MFQFTEFVRPDETLREVHQRHPETEVVFDRHGIRAVCYDCSVEQIAIKIGVPAVDLLLELDQAVYSANHVAA